MRASRGLLHLGSHHFTESLYEGYLASLKTREYPAHTRIPSFVRAACRVHTDRPGGFGRITLLPHRRWRATVVFHHGGAYTDPLDMPHWIMSLSLLRALDARIILADYPLAPEHSVHEALPWLREVHDEALACRGPVWFAGDSAGGGLALSSAMDRRDRGLSLPWGLILFSPWVDLCMDNPEIPALEALDPLLCCSALEATGRWWSRGNPGDTAASPLRGRLGGLPPVQVYQGSHDILAPDARLLARRLKEAGGEVDYREYPGAYHDFMGAFLTPEARDVYACIRQHARSRCLARQGAGTDCASGTSGPALTDPVA